MEITKSQLLEIWESYCDKAEDPDMFFYYHSDDSESYGLRINNNISLNIQFYMSQNLYNIDLIFSDVIRYKSFTINNVEYNTSIDMWEKGGNKATKTQKDKTISEGLVELEKLLIQFQTT